MLLAVAQSPILPGAPGIQKREIESHDESCDGSRDESPDGVIVCVNVPAAAAGLKTFRQENEKEYVFLQMETYMYFSLLFSLFYVVKNNYMSPMINKIL